MQCEKYGGECRTSSPPIHLLLSTPASQRIRQPVNGKQYEPRS
jgi:hypothetical protein